MSENVKPEPGNRKIRLSIIGCGRISRNHFGAIEKHQSDLELASVCDINETVRAEQVEKYGIPGYTSLEE